MIEKFSRIKVDLDLDKVFPNLQQICKRKKFILFNLMRLKRENSIREITFIKIRKLILNENRDKIRIIPSFVLHEIESNEIMIKLYQFYPEYLFERNSFYREILFSSLSLFFPPQNQFRSTDLNDLYSFHEWLNPCSDRRIVTFRKRYEARSGRIKVGGGWSRTNKGLFGSYLAGAREGLSEKDLVERSLLRDRERSERRAIKRNSFDRLSRPNNWKRSRVPGNGTRFLSPETEMMKNTREIDYSLGKVTSDNNWPITTFLSRFI